MAGLSDPVTRLVSHHCRSRRSAYVNSARGRPRRPSMLDQTLTEVCSLEISLCTKSRSAHFIHCLTMSYSPYDVPKLLADIRINDRNLTNGHEDARLQCLAAARTLCHALETPREAIITRCYAQVRATLPFLYFVVIIM